MKLVSPMQLMVLDFECIDVDEFYIEDIIEQANLIKNQYDSACETLDIVLKNHFSDIYYTLEPDYAGTKCEEIALEMTY